MDPKYRYALLGAAAALGILVFGGAAIVVSGAYDVAADAPHAQLTRAVIAYARARSIAARANAIAVPALGDPKMISEGAEHYSAMCMACHLAPGMAENEMRPGMNPRPPILAALPRGNPATQFWIVKHGIKMTAMPAWGATHSDEEIWNIVAFLQKLPSLTPQSYRALVAAGGHGHDMDMNMDMGH